MNVKNVKLTFLSFSERRREGDPQLWMDPGCQGQVGGDHQNIFIIIFVSSSYNDIMWTGRATQQFWKSTTQKSALAKGTVATLPPRKIFLCFFPDQYIFHFLFQHFNNDLQELHLCDCRPVHHGSWLPVTLDHPHLSNGGQSNLSRADGDRIQQTHKNFPQKNRCDHQTNLFDLRSCLQMRKFEVVHKPSGGPAFSPELLSTQSLGFCSATRLWNVEYFKSSS